MSMWCVVCYEDEYGLKTPCFFATKKEAREYIRKEAEKKRDELIEFSETNTSEDYTDRIRVEVSNYEYFIEWQGFDVTECTTKILDTEAKE